MGAYRFRQLRGKRNRKPYATTTTLPETDRDKADRLDTSSTNDRITERESNQEPENTEVSLETSAIPENPVVGRLMSSLTSLSPKKEEFSSGEKITRPEEIPNITSIFTKGPGVQTRIETLFDGLETHEIRSLQRKNQQNQEKISEHHESSDYENGETELPDNDLEDAKTIGPYDSSQDYANDQPETSISHDNSKGPEEDTSTILPDAEPAYRYNIKVRSNGKVLDPPSK
uniref:Nlrp5 protein n=1 Tax=Fopius arisanus TaxID=64838 RepID=A0A0C9QB34_9HYME